MYNDYYLQQIDVKLGNLQRTNCRSYRKPRKFIYKN